MKNKHKLGCQKDLPDIRDQYYETVSAPQVFPPSLDLRPHMPPVYDQGQLGCHDSATEVLTEKGWQKWADYDLNSALGTIDKETGILEFQKPTSLQRYDYDGPLYYSTNRSVDFALTPNHRMLQRSWNQKARTLNLDYDFKTIENCGWYYGLPHAPTSFKGVELKQIAIDSHDYQGDDFIALVSLIISDGWVGGTENNKHTCSFCCFREDRLPFVRALAQRLSLHEIPGRPHVWKFANAPLANWLRANCFSPNSPLRSPYKLVPAIIKTLDVRQISLFLKFYGDSSNNQEFFYSSSKTIIDDLQELHLRVGKRSSIYERDPRNTQFSDGRRIDKENCTKDITLVVRQTDRLSITRKDHIESDHYKGEVFCASVPNSTLITRRNGSVLISGNSCTANGIAGALEWEMIKENLTPFVPSRLFIYYNERVLENTVQSDAGAQIRDGIKSVASTGYCDEHSWPYNIAKFTDKPNDAAYTEAKEKHHHAISYKRLVTPSIDFKTALSNKNPVIIGFLVLESFYSIGADGMMPLPQPSERVEGGHCVLIVGWDDHKQVWICRNSWADSWGDKGYFCMPYSFANNPNYLFDAWTVGKV